MPQVSSVDTTVESFSKVRKTISKLLPANEDAATTIPICAHGPALKFNRIDKSSGLSREFYACSANRDRKICPLFHWVEDWERKLKRGGKIHDNLADDESRRAKKSKPDEELGVSALVDNESNAQYLFDKSTVQTLLTLIKPVIVPDRPVLCIGAPLIHAALLRENIDSYLLDEDERLCSIHANTFRFNMFNGTFYTETLKQDNFCLIVSDPPFHPELLPAMFGTIERLFPVSFAASPIMFAFPYFNIKAVQDAMPRLERTDIRLTYRNHKKYTSGEQTPVRLFVANMPIVPAGSHQLCVPCNRVVHKANHHCELCNACTTIAGPVAYIHCKDCKKCVKPKSIHCKICKRCHVGPHRD